MEVWAWDVGACDWFLDVGRAVDGPGQFTLVSFDGFRDDITFTSASVAASLAAVTRDKAMSELGGGSGGSGGCGGGGGSSTGEGDGGGGGGDSCSGQEDEDDDWAMCPITCEPIMDPVLVRGGCPRHFERSALEAWVARAGSCPLTRRPLDIADVVPPAPAFAARLAARRAREGLA